MFKDKNKIVILVFLVHLSICFGYHVQSSYGKIVVDFTGLYDRVPLNITIYKDPHLKIPYLNLNFT
ncbi:hypothetical protein DICPUDRAFT_146892 [Dictyostelium purpureum]|uniref:Uncharacterized protein n=1 Tax=Dictyostelium purpureum TaxID=5786 RepID=F0Z760_DICPU|nr:uncharacterized protein DICPUDRAFT_146892 [Dictyostelium purpureum]EGC40184.1 hypothetical protein DICPUDRAFT_146892 [Dictyostelium purpureum]|eukprot:XP_003283253.1 hypothetical protein DICPUDRAFT_146892 [Dictyostelium purpureum]